MNERPLFILAGNGPYLNRGCEAIVRGTINILRQQYKNPRFICISHFNSKEEFQDQQKSEIDVSVQHLSSYRLHKYAAISTLYRPEAWKYTYRNFINKKRLGYSIYKDILSHLPEAKAVLSVGGDNYSLDYGIPSLFTLLDDLVLNENKPLIIWGASVGPFDKMPDYEVYMSHHLREVTGIFVRESTSVDYLNSLGVAENVYHVADPAFLMEPIKPKGIENYLSQNEKAIGLNFSPLMARYVCGGDREKWTSIVASIIDEVAQKTGMPIYLIPHVTVSESDDYSFMHQALSLTKKGNKNIILVPPKYSAAETKWIIGRMAIFVGSRTHSTIAAISSGVPTLSLAYSIKSKGINRDIFGHNDYCLEPMNLNVESISNRINHMLEQSSAIKRILMDRMAEVKGAALGAGATLKYIIEDN